MARTVDEVKADAVRGAVDAAWEFVFSNVPLASFQAAMALNAAFVAQGRTNAAAMLAPLFAFVADVQARTNACVRNIAAAQDEKSVWGQRETLDFSGITVPTINVWAITFPQN